jgi:hypothetical protein
VLKGIAAATTKTMLRAGAPRAKALVAGYAGAARRAVLVLQAGATVATSIPTGTDSLMGGVQDTYCSTVGRASSRL